MELINNDTHEQQLTKQNIREWQKQHPDKLALYGRRHYEKIKIILNI